VGSGQEWWSNEEARLRAEAEQRWQEFKAAHQGDLDELRAQDLADAKGFLGSTPYPHDRYGVRLNQLRAEFLAAERVRKELEQRRTR
jgi:hypothetical protein